VPLASSPFGQTRQAFAECPFASTPAPPESEIPTALFVVRGAPTALTVDAFEHEHIRNYIADPIVQGSNIQMPQTANRVHLVRHARTHSVASDLESSLRRPIALWPLIVGEMLTSLDNDPVTVQRHTYRHQEWISQFA